MIAFAPDPTASQNEIRFSIVVPSFNQGFFLEECITGLLSQVNADTEVIVVDGGSSDDSLAVIHRYAAQLAWWCSEPDAGQSDALNKGFHHARGEWLTWLNSDDLLLAGALESVRTFLDQNHHAVWVVGAGRMIDENGVIVSQYTEPKRPLWAKDLSPWTDTWFGQPGCFFRRSLYEEAGGYVDPHLHYALDLDLWLRLGAHAPLLPIPAELGAYRLHSESKTVAQRAPMEVEVVHVLLDRLGPEAALERVKLLAADRVEIESRYRRLTTDLQSLSGWWRLLERRWSQK